MSYPSITARQATKLVDALLKVNESTRVDLPLAESDYVVEVPGDLYDRRSIEAVAAQLRSEWDTAVGALPDFSADDLYVLEILFSSRIHRALVNLPIDQLEDEGFWRYLALFPFRWYLIAREGKNLKPQNFGGLIPRGDGDESEGEDADRDSPFVNQCLYRAFIVGQAIFDYSDSDNPYSRVNAIPRGGPVTDVWHSHVLRVQIGRIGRVPHALIDATSTVEVRDMKDFARKVAKLVTRLKSNVLLDGYAKSDLDVLLAGFDQG